MFLSVLHCLSDVAKRLRGCSGVARCLGVIFRGCSAVAMCFLGILGGCSSVAM